MNSFTTTFGSLLLIGFLAAGAETVMACGNGKLILEDKFGALDPAWSFPGNTPNRSNGPGGLVYKLDPRNELEFLNQSGFFNDYELCAVFATKVPDDAGAWAGVVLWGSDLDNFYLASISPAKGAYGVIRLQNGKGVSPVPETKSDSIHKGTDVTNEISVVVKANKATLAINGKKLIDFTGWPPEGGSLFGFGFGTYNTDKGPSTITLKSIQLREVEAEPKRSQTGPQPPASVQQPAAASGQPGTETAQPQSPAATAQPPAAVSGQPGTAAAQPQSPSATVQQPAAVSGQPQPPGSSGAAAKPMPSAEGITVALGDPRDLVRQAYPAATETGAGDLVVASDGVKFFFTKDKVLRQIMVEAPYKGSVDGIKIGDTAEDVVARRGQPDDITKVYGGSGYLYRVAGNILRYDIDEKSKKVTDVSQILVGR